MKMISRILLGVALAASLCGVGFAESEPITPQASAQKKARNPWKSGGVYSTMDLASARAAELQGQGYETTLVAGPYGWIVNYRMPVDGLL